MPTQDQMVDWVLQTIRTRESGGNYTIRNPHGTASGAYQFTNATWRALGGTRYAPTAAQASRAQQDEIARRHVLDIYRRFGTWEAVPIIWYVGHMPQNLDYVPGRGNRLTVRQYRDEWLGQLAQISGGQTPSMGAGPRQDAQGGARRTVLDAAFSALGIMYQWGGNSLATGVDCSGLVQQAYAQVGIKLPRVSADQARAGQAIGIGELRPGDLVWWDNSTRNRGADHVAIYIGQRNGQHYVIEAPGRGRQIRVAPLRQNGANFTRIDMSQANPAAGNPGGLGRSGQRWSDSEWATELLEIDAGGDASLGGLLEMDDATEDLFEMRSTRVSMPSWRQGLPDRSLPERAVNDVASRMGSLL
jgi:cell wall-associated NlpC family hydrolase